MKIIITGASSGIGFELAKRFLELGHELHLFARNLDVLHALRNNYQNCHVYQVDVRNFEELQKVTKNICDNNSTIDMVIANAGISIGHSEGITSFCDFKSVIDTNFTSVHALFEPIIHKMIEQKSGKLVAISSLASFVAMPTTAAYSSSKRALNSYMDSLRLMLKPYDIKVINIQPGFIKTPLTDKNNFKMPFFMELENGVDEIMHAIKNDKPNHAFPLVFASFVKLIALLPASLRDRLIFRLSAKAYGKR